MSLHDGTVDHLPAVEAELNYLTPMLQRPRYYAEDPPAGVARSNITSEAHHVTIRDIRPLADDFSLDEHGFTVDFSLDEHGFTVVRQASELRDFHDEDGIFHIYYPEAEALVTSATGADRVFIFDHVVRRHVPGGEDRRGGVRQPAWRVHVDHTARSGPQRVRDLLPKSASKLLNGRVQIINVWRPLRGPVRNAPLALCDAATVATDDLVPSDLVYPERIGETYSVTYNPGHRWFYLSGMEPTEAFLIKCFDSSTDGRARFAPHTAFKDPTAPADAPARESIELRTLVFHEHSAG